MLTLQALQGPLTRLVHCFGTVEEQGLCLVWRARRGGPRTLSRTTDVNLDCVRLRNTLNSLIQILVVGGGEGPLDPPPPEHADNKIGR